jgi:hypothetical protein
VRTALQHVPPGGLSEADLWWLAKANLAGPASEALDLQSVAKQLLTGDLQLFRVKGDAGVVLTRVSVGVGGLKRLGVVRSALTRGWAGFRLPQIVADLGRLARSWDCVAVETVCYDRRLATALGRLGATEEAVVMVLQIAEETKDELR